MAVVEEDTTRSTHESNPPPTATASATAVAAVAAAAANAQRRSTAAVVDNDTDDELDLGSLKNKNKAVSAVGNGNGGTALWDPHSVHTTTHIAAWSWTDLMKLDITIDSAPVVPAIVEFMNILGDDEVFKGKKWDSSVAKFNRKCVPHIVVCRRGDKQKDGTTNVVMLKSKEMSTSNSCAGPKKLLNAFFDELKEYDDAEQLGSTKEAAMASAMKWCYTSEGAGLFMAALRSLYDTKTEFDAYNALSKDEKDKIEFQRHKRQEAALGMIHGAHGPNRVAAAAAASQAAIASCEGGLQAGLIVGPSEDCDANPESRLSNGGDDDEPKMSFKERLLRCKEGSEERRGGREERLKIKAAEKVAAGAHKRKLQEQAQDQRTKDAELDRTGRKMKMLSDAYDLKEKGILSPGTYKTTVEQIKQN